jgi:hypothetical protein
MLVFGLSKVPSLNPIVSVKGEEEAQLRYAISCRDKCGVLRIKVATSLCKLGTPSFGTPKVGLLVCAMGVNV